MKFIAQKLPLIATLLMAFFLSACGGGSSTQSAIPAFTATVSGI